MIFVSERISLGDHEIRWTFTRASGAGGQHVNRTESAAVLEFHVPSSSLPAPMKARLLARRDHRLAEDGTLSIKAQEHRSQIQNREAAVTRLVEFLRSALVAPRKRVATKPTKGSKKRRLESKSRRGDLKSDRKRPDGNEG